MTVNRVVAVLTPVFTVASVAISQLVLTRFGFHVAPEALVPVETTVAVAAVGAALSWLHGHQKYEALVHDGLMAELAIKHVQGAV
jgi:hypothetical protein